MIFDLGFGERCLIFETPVNRSRALVNPATLDEAREHARRLGFIVVRHREVGIIPPPKNSEPLEVTRLTLQRILSVLATNPAKSFETQIALLLAFFLERALDVGFDGQTVTVI